MVDRPRRRRYKETWRDAARDYGTSAGRTFVAACLVYIVIQATYLVAERSGWWMGSVVVGGTGIVLGLVVEWLRRKGI